MKFIVSVCYLFSVASFAIADPTTEEGAALSLKVQLDEFKSNFEAIASKDKIEGYNAGVAAVKASGIIEKAKSVGAKAPSFVLTDSTGNSIALEALLKEGPVVLTWYRGGWCPYCNITLAALQKALPEIKEAGAQLVALTPELPDKSLSTKQKFELGFHVLSDLNNQVANQYGIVFQLTDFVEDAMRNFAELKKWNGQAYKENELPLSATYIIDKQGIIRWAFLDAEYRNRAEPAEIIAELKKLQ
jgi:peroxiredoxin